MKNKYFKIINLLLALTLIVNFAFAEKVTVEKAKQVGKNYYYQKSGISEKQSYNKINLELSYIGVDMLDTTFYAFSDKENNGFIIVSADDRVMPILAFSNEESFDKNNIPPSCKYFIDGYSEQIAYAKRINYRATEDTENDWNKLSATNFKDISITEVPSAPLLLTKWNQGYPYNEACPADNASSDGHALVGCVAISMSQIMKYYNYPEQGSGFNSYSASGYGTQSANFGNTHYEFSNMPFVATESNPDLSLFLYHCGVGAEMHYGVEGSGASTNTALYAMQNYFNFSSNWDYDPRSWYTDYQWLSLIKNEIDNLRPMIYVGYDGQSGHAWNCDGYQNDLIHMNWGWGGSANGFFTVSNLLAGGYNFSSGQKVAYNLYPGGNYPSYCNSVNNIYGVEGNFNDGSGPENYQNNSSCFWTILPECGQNIYLSFNYFDVKSGDTLYIYDGTSLSDPILAKLSNEMELPEDLFSDKGGILINFVTNNSNTGGGWTISYSVDFCGGTSLITEANGNINDGSGNCNYKNASLCRWTINPANALSISLDFTEFDLFPGIDNVKIYKDEISSDNLIEKFNYSNHAHSLTVNSDKVIVYFFSDSEGNAGGWSLNYNSVLDPNEINDIELAKEFNMWPNPAYNNLNLSINSEIKEEINLTIINTLGEVLYNSSTTNNNIVIDIKSFAQGIYFVKLNTEQNVISKMFIKK